MHEYTYHSHIRMNVVGMYRNFKAIYFSFLVLIKLKGHLRIMFTYSVWNFLTFINSMYLSNAENTYLQNIIL